MPKLTARFAAFSAAAVLVPTLMLAGVASSVGVAAAASTTAAATEDGAGAAGPRLESAIRRLGLTPEQRNRIRTILASHKDELAAELTAVREKRGALFQAIHADTFDEPAIRSAAAAAGQAETALAVTRGRIASEVRPVLTAEQQAKAKRMLARASAAVDGILSRVLDRLDSLG